MQIVHNNFDDFFGNDRPKLDQLSSNIRQFEIWTKWTILTSAIDTWPLKNIFTLHIVIPQSNKERQKIANIFNKQ